MAESNACLNVLNGTVTGATPTTFDNGNGFVYLLDGAGCWTELLNQIDEQLALAESGLNQLRALHLPTDIVEEAIADVANAREYSAGEMVLASW